MMTLSLAARRRIVVSLALPLGGRAMICPIRRLLPSAAAAAAALCLAACGTAQAVIHRPLTSLGYVPLPMEAGPSPLIDQLILDHPVNDDRGDHNRDSDGGAGRHPDPASQRHV